MVSASESIAWPYLLTLRITLANLTADQMEVPSIRVATLRRRSISSLGSSVGKPRRSEKRVAELFPRYWRRTLLAVLIVLSLGLLVGRNDLNSHHICQHEGLI